MSEAYDISVDPGVEGAWAAWPVAQHAELQPPQSTGLVVPPDGKWMDRVWVLPQAIDNLCKLTRVRRIVCEWPKFHECAPGQVVAATGSLVKLACSVGMIMEVARRHQASFVPIEIADWKGQMTKKAVEARILKRFPLLPLKSHEYDAVGIGLYHKGFF
jgi:hypothetical protein